MKFYCHAKIPRIQLDRKHIHTAEPGWESTYMAQRASGSVEGCGRYPSYYFRIEFNVGSTPLFDNWSQYSIQVQIIFEFCLLNQYNMR